MELGRDGIEEYVKILLNLIAICLLGTHSAADKVNKQLQGLFLDPNEIINETIIYHYRDFCSILKQYPLDDLNVITSELANELFLLLQNILTIRAVYSHNL